MKNVLEWLEKSVLENKNKNIYTSVKKSITFKKVYDNARIIGTELDKILNTNKPVAVMMEKDVDTPIVFFGVVYSGRAYAPVDWNLPNKRIQKILETLKPDKIITQRHLEDKITEYVDKEKLCFYEDLVRGEVNENRLVEIRRSQIAIDPLCIIFTSGSSGNPKGVILSHLSLMTYLNAYSSVMKIESNDRIGNQSPLDYIAAIRDMYLPIMMGAQTFIIPKDYFMAPGKLFDFLNMNKITSVSWSVSAFSIASKLGVFSEYNLVTLRKICFSGSVMPCKVLRQWQKKLPNALFVNQYGPTETTASCTYYIVDHMVEEDEVLPIGKPYDSYRIYLIKDDNTLADEGEEGEICVAGTGLTLGYYNDKQRTDLNFVNNPSNSIYPEKIYRTGDIGLKREDGNLEFYGRRDRQIKHMGHRVELDEIECATSSALEVIECGCIYDHENEKLILYYVGEINKKELVNHIRGILPGFMVPRKIRKVETIPKLPNGKINYVALKGEK